MWNIFLNRKYIWGNEILLKNKNMYIEQKHVYFLVLI